MAKVLLAITIAIFLTLVFIAVHTENECVSYATVEHVGTCNYEGYCTTIFTDHSYSKEYKPFVGEDVCKRHEDKFKW